MRDHVQQKERNHRNPQYLEKLLRSAIFFKFLYRIFGKNDKKYRKQIRKSTNSCKAELRQTRYIYSKDITFNKICSKQNVGKEKLFFHEYC